LGQLPLPEADEVLAIMIVIQNPAVQAVAEAGHKLMHTVVAVAEAQVAAEAIVGQQLTQEMNQLYREYLDKEIPADGDIMTVAALAVLEGQELLLQSVVVQLHEQAVVAEHHG
jgi:hypothetical protein